MGSDEIRRDDSQIAAQAEGRIGGLGFRLTVAGKAMLCYAVMDKDPVTQEYIKMGKRGQQFFEHWLRTTYSILRPSVARCGLALRINTRLW